MENNTSQKDVPTEVIVHYIVRDYQRMFNAHDKMLQLIEDLKKHYESAVREKEELAGKVKTLKTENNSLKTRVEYLSNRVSSADTKKAKKIVKTLRRIKDIVNSPLIDEFDEEEVEND